MASSLSSRARERPEDFDVLPTRYVRDELYRTTDRRRDRAPPGSPTSGKTRYRSSHLAQAIGVAAVHAGFRVLYREAHRLFEELVLATALGERPALLAKLTDVPLLIVDDLGMRKLPTSAAEDLLEIIMRRYERRLDHRDVQPSARRLA